MVTAVEVVPTRVGVTPPPEMVTPIGEVNPVPSMTTSVAEGRTIWLGVMLVTPPPITTEFEATEAGPVPTPLVAVTVNE